MSYNSDHFNVSNWKITLPEDASGGNGGGAIEVKNLVGYEHPEHFYDAPDGAMVFMAEADGATTGGSKYARSELREMNGGKLAGWNLDLGGTMTATLKVDETPTTSGGAPGRIIVGQIHGQEEELIRLYYENGHVYFMNERAGPHNEELKFTFKNAAGEEPDIALGETFSYMIDARGATLTVKALADGQVYSSVSSINSVWQDDSFYFKAGVYMGINETNGHGSGKASFYGLDFSHEPGKGLGGWNADHIPDPTPTVPGGNDPTPIPPTVPGGNDGDSGGVNPVDPDVWASAGKGGEKLSGNSSANDLTGDSGNDTLKGRGGNDVMNGGGGGDYLEGNEGNDTLCGNAGHDVVKGGLGVDSYIYRPGDGTDHIIDFTEGETIDLTAFGFASYDAFMQSVTLESTAEGLLIDFGGDNKLVARGLQIDQLHIAVKLTDGHVPPGDGSIDDSAVSWKALLGEEETVTEGTAARDKMSGDGSRNIFDGKGEGDVLKGRGGEDVLHGGAGNDYLEGGDGDDLLIGGLGADTMKGGGGEDMFVFADTDEGGDVITNFNGDDGDRLNLHLLAENALKDSGTDDYFATAIVVIQEVDDSVRRVTVDADGTEGAGEATLLVTVHGDLSETDFVF